VDVPHPAGDPKAATVIAIAIVLASSFAAAHTVALGRPSTPRSWVSSRCFSCGPTSRRSACGPDNQRLLPFVVLGVWLVVSLAALIVVSRALHRSPAA
jgi:hypothetical protein